MRQHPMLGLAPGARNARHKPVLLAVGVMAGLTMLVAGCSTSGKSAASTGLNPAGTSTGGQADSAAGPTYAAAAAPMSAPPALPSASSGTSASGGGSSGSAAPLLANRDVIYTADITVRATNIKQAVTSVESLVGNHGGVVYAEEVDLTPKNTDNPGDASATITLKVPPDQLAATLNDVGGIGTEVSRNENSDDVTSKVVDVKARISAAQASIARLTDLLSHTGSVADLLNVENQLAQRDSDLESLEQQQKALAAQTSMATITVHLMATPPVAKAIEKPKQAHVFGFLRGLKGGWHAFTKTVSAFATAVGAVLPFLVLLAVLGAVILIGRRRFSRTRHSPEPPAPLEQS